MATGGAPWAESAESVLAQLGVTAGTGLSSEEAAARLASHGPNALEKEPPTPLWRLVLEQFNDILVQILLLAAAVSFALAFFEEDAEGEGLRAFIEPLVILLILVLNAIVGVWQESNAENALEALKSMQPDQAKVRRDGRLLSALPAEELVPGDIVLLATGDKVPADARIVSISTATLRAEQSSLTGEAVAVQKVEEPVGAAECELQAKDSMLFSGTAIANGSAVAVVTATGMGTELGKIQADIQSAADEVADTPLKRKLNVFGEQLARVIFYVCVLVWSINYSHFMSWERQPGSVLPDLSTFSFSLSKCTYYFKIAVALAVAAIPEGLPAVITTCLALGTRKMAAQNAIIRRLPSVETLGCTTVICSDKTGTLTTNQMSAVTFVTMSNASTRVHEVVGTSYSPGEGRVLDLQELDAALNALADVCALCGEAAIALADPTPGGHTGFRCVGAPTEAALVVLAEKIGLSDRTRTATLAHERRVAPAEHPMPIVSARRAARPRLAVLEFDRQRKSMSVIVPGRGRGGLELLVKGAAECVLERCTRVMLPDGSAAPLDGSRRAAVLRAVGNMAAGALRCLAFAVRDLKGTPLEGYLAEGGSAAAAAALKDMSRYEEFESDLTFVGLAGLQDPPRPEVADAIRRCRVAGIRVVVITGDNKDTAEAISRNIGLFHPTEDISDVSMTGRHFAQLPPAAKTEVLASGRPCCFSRAEPRDKQDIVRLLKSGGEVVAMTGDGVNDAPALKLADIGVAMGINGTEVAKEASDMVLADDNFSTIVAAVREGRSIFDNMKAFIRYMISSNIGEVASIFLTAALGLPEGLIPVQLLWVNLVTDGPPATALGFNPADTNVMRRPPRNPAEPLITSWVLFRYLVVGAYVGFATVGVFAAWFLAPDLFGIPITWDGHSPVTWHQLTHFSDCPSWPRAAFNPTTSYRLAGGGLVSWTEPCDMFEAGKVKASTLSLTTLVAIEMFNALNALSEDGSLLVMPPWCNPWLLVAMLVSFGLHFLVLYVPPLAAVFGIVPLSFDEWLLVLLFAAPVILIDEVLKCIGRLVVHPLAGKTDKSE